MDYRIKYNLHKVSFLCIRCIFTTKKYSASDYEIEDAIE